MEMVFSVRKDGRRRKRRREEDQEKRERERGGEGKLQTNRGPSEEEGSIGVVQEEIEPRKRE